jgi:beta-galactosidase/beta-glucuronidase
MLKSRSYSLYFIIFFIFVLVMYQFYNKSGLTSYSLRSNSIPKEDSASPYHMATIWGEALDPSKPWPEYPRPQFIRQPIAKSWLNLNGYWDIKKGHKDEDQIADIVALSHTGFHQQVVVPFPIESQLSGIHRHWEYMWYKKNFQLPSYWKKEESRIILHFEAVDWETEVYFNNLLIGKHAGGYDSFSFDITKHIQTDFTGANHTLLVRVHDPTNFGNIANGKQVVNRFYEASGIWYTPSSGIWQTVWLEAVSSQGSIDSTKIYPDIHDSKVDIHLSLSLAEKRQYRVDILITSQYGHQISQTLSITEANLKSPVLSISIPKDQLFLWSPDDPHLYSLRLTLVDETTKLNVDIVDSYFGMRSISVGIPENESYPRILFNDKFLFQAGVLDQGYWPDGIYTAASDAAIQYDIQLIKSLGFNMVRKHIKIEPLRWYYWCDVLGLLVWQDMPSPVVLDKNFWHNLPNFMTISQKTQFETELEHMVTRLFNTPSIVLWVVFNEEWFIYDYERLANHTMSLDSTRLVTANSGTGNGAKIYTSGGQIRDVHSYPPPKSPEKDVGVNPRPVVNGEYGGIFLEIKGHTWDPLYGDFQAKKNNFLVMKSHEEMTKKYESFCRMVKQMKDQDSLSAAVFTQLIDVENELNGFRTYDRKIAKGIYSRIAKANRMLYEP